jgi:translation initiation factor IF-1
MVRESAAVGSFYPGDTLRNGPAANAPTFCAHGEALSREPLRPRVPGAPIVFQQEVHGMAVEEKIVVDADVTEALPNLMFKIKLDNGHEALVKLAGKMRRRRIRVNPGDRVRAELSTYDISRGRIVYRLK